MSDELQLWVRLVQNAVSFVLVLMALSYCVALWLEDRRLYLTFGIAALLALLALLFLRIAAVPDPPLLAKNFIEVASLIVNAIWPLFGLAWLAVLLRDRLRMNRLRRKYGLNKSEMENGN